MNKIFKKNGYSLVEAVIALSVITIVSITAFSIMLSSISTKVSAINKTEAQNFASDILECFKASENEEEFLSLVDFAEDDISLEGGEGSYTYYSEKYKFTANISVSYPIDGRSELLVDVSDDDGENIISVPYKKGN